ncbi:hypothetical protein [Methylobacterium gossipiicola]|uniref:hypothetical protein n=1 Tax=Methylobacterium gossipiicola TaxID=582675 RepID=UPI0011602CB8|nr:hypothetical protein [Methylobacterium gossipiicola]
MQEIQDESSVLSAIYLSNDDLKEKRRIADKANLLGCSPALVEYIERLEAQIQELGAGLIPKALNIRR